MRKTLGHSFWKNSIKRSRIYLECFQHWISGPGHSCTFPPTIGSFSVVTSSFISIKRRRRVFILHSTLLVAERDIEKSTFVRVSSVPTIELRLYSSISRLLCKNFSFSYVFSLSIFSFFLVFLHHSTILGFWSWKSQIQRKCLILTPCYLKVLIFSVS